MKLETLITDAWQRKALWLWMLLPLSGLYGLITGLRRQAYKTGLLASYRAPVPVLVIGNITVGGSGKTPLIISLVDYLQQRGVKVGVISRGYGGDSSQMPALVKANSMPSTVGDEPCLIVSSTGVPMAVCADRQQAITTLLSSYPDIQLIIADDGLQHYAMQRDIEWIVVDSARGFGNRQLLPTGFLREPMSRLKESTVIYHEKLDEQSKSQQPPLSTETLSMHLAPDDLNLLLADELIANSSATIDSAQQAPRTGSTVHAVSGIGYPKRFFETLNTLGFEIIEHPYPDHYDFSLLELLQYTEYPIVVTSKDAVKIKALWSQQNLQQLSDTFGETQHKQDYYQLAARLWVLPVTAELSPACYQVLDQQLKTLGIGYSDIAKS